MKTKTVYQHDEFGVYVGTTEAFESPLEPGVFHLPAGCVSLEPPKTAEDQAALWTGDAWTIVSDCRGQTWYSGASPVVVDFLGDPAASGYSKERPAPTLDELKTLRIAAIVAAADSLLGIGAPVDGGLHVALDDGSRADLTAMAATATAASSGAVPWPASYSRGWIAIENVRLPLATPEAGLSLAAAAGNYYAAIVQHRRDLKDAVLTAESVTALDTVDVSAGWPG